LHFGTIQKIAAALLGEGTQAQPRTLAGRRGGFLG
jgi:hypothetical protein